MDQEERVASITKADLLAAVAEQSGVSRVDAERVLDAYFDVVVEGAQRGDKVGWPGFGSFSAARRPARMGRNPQTGAPVKIAASTALKFSASSVLKAELNTSKK